MDDAPYNTICIGRNMLETLRKTFTSVNCGGDPATMPGFVDMAESVIDGALGYINDGLEDMHKELEAAKEAEKSA